jgi:hypothetical protein
LQLLICGDWRHLCQKKINKDLFSICAAFDISNKLEEGVGMKKRLFIDGNTRNIVE